MFNAINSSKYKAAGTRLPTPEKSFHPFIWEVFWFDITEKQYYKNAYTFIFITNCKNILTFFR